MSVWIEKYERMPAEARVQTLARMAEEGVTFKQGVKHKGDWSSHFTEEQPYGGWAIHAAPDYESCFRATVAYLYNTWKAHGKL